jgi:uncharacterized protein YbjQ (UPF0145 family)
MMEGASAKLITSTTNDLPGYRTVRNLGVVRGLVVRSCNIVGNFIASIQMLWGGNITLYTQMCEQARLEAFDIMLRNAQRLGANAVLGVGYDSAELIQSCTEVLAYGTAVVVERE